MKRMLGPLLVGRLLLVAVLPFGSGPRCCAEVEERQGEPRLPA